MAFIPPAIAAISSATASAGSALGIGSAAAAGTAATTAASTGLATGIAGVGGATASALPVGGDLAGASLGAIQGISTASVPLAVPSWLSTVGTIGTGLNALGGVIGAAGAIKTSQAQASASKYNASIAAENSAQALSNANIASASGSEQAGISSEKTRQTVGALTANEGASGIDVNSGSNLDVRSSQADVGRLDALTLRSNAAREAYGYQTQANNFSAESQLERTEASGDLTAGAINAGSTLLGSAGTAATNFARFQLAGGFSG